MGHELDLSSYNIRTDLLIDEVDTLKEDEISIKNKEIDDIKINITTVTKENKVKKKGTYTTITFEDITDKDNFNKVQKVLEEELKVLVKALNLKKDYKTLIIGLGNRNSTPDSLGVKTCENIIVTRHLFELKELSDEYSVVASFAPNVMGNTGIEAQDIIKGIIKEINIDLLIVVDALASSNIERVNKTIQLTDTGISPGSGVGNSRKELSKTTLNPSMAKRLNAIIPIIPILNNIVSAAQPLGNLTFPLFKRIFFMFLKKTKIPTPTIASIP